MDECISRTGAWPANEERILNAAFSTLATSGPQPESALRVAARSLRVLTLTPFYPSTEDPSQGSFVAELVSATKRQGIRNYVIAVQPFYRPAARADANEDSCIWKGYFSIPGNSGLALAGVFLAASLERQVRLLHAQEPFDLIHAHAPLPCGRAAAVLSHKLRIPFIVSVHGLDAFAARQGGPLWGKWCRWKSIDVFRAASAVVCVSQKVCHQVAQCPGVKSIVIHNSVDANLFAPGPEASPLTVLSVGNLIPIKGHALLLRAFAQAAASAPSCRLEIIGDGPERERLVRMAAELAIDGRVSFLGRQNRGAVARAMNRCAVFVLPSWYEGLGCVYLEAMASAKPAIGCAGQGIDEIIESGKNGMLVSPRSQEDLASALRTLLLNQDFRVRLGTAARATILQRHTLVHQAMQLAQIYGECAA